MKRSILLWTIIPSLLLVACGGGLPSERPADFSAGYSFDGGMLPYGESLTIDPDGSRYAISNEGLTLEILFEATPEELDALYETIRDNRIDRIKARREDGVYDRGGISIRASYGEESFRASDSGNSFVTDQWLDEFQNIESALNAFVTPTDPASGTPFTIVWDREQSYMPDLTITVQMGSGFGGISGGRSGDDQATIFAEDMSTADILFFSESLLIDQPYRLDLTASSGFTFSVADNGLTITPLP